MSRQIVDAGIILKSYQILLGSKIKLKCLRRAKKNSFLGENFPKYGWVGWLIPKPAQTLQITPKTNHLFFYPNFTFRVPKSYKNPGVGGWFKDLGKFSKKCVFYGSPYSVWRKQISDFILLNFEAVGWYVSSLWVLRRPIWGRRFYMETRCVTKLSSKKNTNYFIMKEAREEITRQAFLKGKK